MSEHKACVLDEIGRAFTAVNPVDELCDIGDGYFKRIRQLHKSIQPSQVHRLCMLISLHRYQLSTTVVLIWNKLECPTSKLSVDELYQHVFKDGIENTKTSDKWQVAPRFLLCLILSCVIHESLDCPMYGTQGICSSSMKRVGPDRPYQQLHDIHKQLSDGIHTYRLLLRIKIFGSDNQQYCDALDVQNSAKVKQAVRTLKLHSLDSMQQKKVVNDIVIMLEGLWVTCFCEGHWSINISRKRYSSSSLTNSILMDSETSVDTLSSEQKGGMAT